MIGPFSKENVALSDFAFFSISLVIRSIWKQSKNEKYLYDEQAMISNVSATDLPWDDFRRLCHCECRF